MSFVSSFGYLYLQGNKFFSRGNSCVHLFSLNLCMSLSLSSGKVCLPMCLSISLWLSVSSSGNSQVYVPTEMSISWGNTPVGFHKGNLYITITCNVKNNDSEQK